MSQSTESTTESNPFTKPGFIIAAGLVVTLIAATIVIFLLPKGQDNAQPAPAPAPAESSSPATASPRASAAAGASVCGLPASSETALGAAPKSSWELVGRMATPTDPTTFGPGIKDEDGFRSCFAHSPAGALYAAANLVALGSSKSQEMNVKLADKLMVPGTGRDAAKEEAATLGTSTGPEESIQVKGFILKSYAPTDANVDLAFQTPAGGLVHAVLPLQWVDGDWKVKVSDAGQLINDVAVLRDLSGFIPWSGV